MNEVPVKQHHKMKERHPQLLDAVDALGVAAAKAGPLSEKVRQFVQLAAAAAVRSEGAVHSHARRAVEALLFRLTYVQAVQRRAGIDD
jgi:alkylhydroperoxidase/carboxymuconolactone decarboxylase family protein YurZ